MSLIKTLVISIAVVLPLSVHAVTEFWVDPDWQGSATGAPETPWTELDNSAWTTINSALAGDDVTVYLSAREDSADVNQKTTDNININREDVSSHRLTLDGMSRYNADDTSPRWTDNTGSGKFEITANYPINTGNQGPLRHNITIRGFKLIATGGQGIYYLGGDNVIIEHNEIMQDTPKHGPGLMFTYARRKGDWEEPCVPGNGHNCGSKNLIIRNNIIHDNYGEAMYVGGVNEYGDPKNYPLHRINEPSHKNVLIENNLIYNVGVWGGEGDAIDVKNGIEGLVVRGNTVYSRTPGTMRDGIIVDGGGIIENNFVYNFGRSGITVSAVWNTYPTRRGVIVRYNVVSGTGGNPAYSWDFGIMISFSTKDDSEQYDQAHAAEIYNNTVYGVADGNGINIAAGLADCRVENNVVAGAGDTEFRAGGGTLREHGYNLLYDENGGTIAWEGSNRYTAAQLTDFEPTSLSVDPQLVSLDSPFVKDNFRPQSGSPCCGAGRGGGDMGAFDCPGATVYTLYTTAENGSVAVSPARAAYDSGAVVVLAPIADNGYAFLRWRGDCAGSASPCTLAMTGNRSVTAVFEPGGGTGLHESVLFYKGTVSPSAQGVFITDLKGRMVRAVTGAAEIRTGQWPNGIYFMHGKDGIKKLVVVH